MAIAAGIAAGSIALIGFGIDSVIEGVASLVIVWRFSGSRLLSAVSERRAQRLVAAQFFLLAPYVAAESLHALLTGDRRGRELGGDRAGAWPASSRCRCSASQSSGWRSAWTPPATRGEGRQNMLCAYLAGALLVGLLGNALLGAWWLDPAVGLVIAGVALVERA